MAKVVNLPVITRLDLSPERVLEAAIEADLEGCVVLGYDADGCEYMASSYANGETVNWLMDRCKKRLLDGIDED